MSLPPLPKQVQVMSRVYKVRRVAQRTIEKDHDGTHDIFADCCPTDCTIRIARGISLESAWGLLEHELGHAFVFELGLKPFLAEDLEEDIVEKLLPAWLGCVRPRRLK